MADTPKLNVTILGGTNSGKTTFLMGMYATLSVGLVSGFSLHCRDRKNGLELLKLWDDFSENGTLPNKNTEVPLLYPFVLKSGVDPWLDFDVLDYRGGVAETGDDVTEVNQVLTHLRQSASLYVVISSEYLTQPITPANRDLVQRETRLRQIHSMLHTAIEERQSAGEPLPSIVILLTMSDLLRDRFASRTESVMVKELLQDLEQLVPLAFAKNISTLVCPVRIGRLGPPKSRTAITESWNPDLVEPKNLHRPIAFTLLHHIQTRAMAIRAALAIQEDQREQKQSESTGLRNRVFGGFFQRERLAALDTAIKAASAKISAQYNALLVTDKQAGELIELLRNVPVLQDGTITNMDLGNGEEPVDDV